MILPPTALRVERSTRPKAARELQRKTLCRLDRALYTGQLDAAIRRLQLEWDTERVLEANAACLLLVSLGLGLGASRQWLWLTAAVAAFLLEHALQGWCPPLPLLRALGVRTAGEIGVERAALKALRGDFSHMGPGAAGALRAARLG